MGLGAWGSKLDFVIGQGWPPTSTSISNCALLPLVGPQPTLGMDSPMLETERQNLGAGGCRQPPRRVLGAATARGAASPRAFGPGTTTERVEMEAVCGVEGAVGMEME